MTDVEQRLAARQFIKDWTDHGDEKQETQRFWISLLQNVFGVEQATNAIEFEVRVKLDHTSFIDGYIKDTRVLIEQKGADIDLRKGYKQSDGSVLTPFQQARRYAGYLPHDMNPRWIVVCNFKEFHIHDMNRPNDTPEIIRLEDLEREYPRLQFLVDKGNERIQKEMEISLQAGALVGKMYDALLKQYNSPASEEELKSLNMLCVRLVFCLYAEDAGIFGSHTMFHDYLKGFQPKNVRKALIDLFKVLDTKVADRDPYMDDELAAFPYVNGGLFADEEIIIPKFTDEIIDLLLTKGSEDFNWSSISPTIFGAVFESTLNPETRRSGGMHYTSIENIHKVIDPLFYDDLVRELDEIQAISVNKTRDQKLEDFQRKLASLTFLDPACGSGNFLTETYLSLRRLENKAVALRLGDQIVLGDSTEFNPIQVSIGQFYGIEINDFAVTVAKTALWIAESQMMKETEEIVRIHMEFLPLTSYANIVEGNALRIDWETVVPKEKLNYIMGNPPFVGQAMRTKEQANDIQNVFAPSKVGGKLDYVAGWFKKAADLSHGTKIETAFVASNSICQGESVNLLWELLLSNGVIINFAHTSFKWTSEAKMTAGVSCVVVGFSYFNRGRKVLFYGQHYKFVDHINGYLQAAPDVFIKNRSKSINKGMSKVVQGSPPADDGRLILSADERKDFINKYPELDAVIKPFTGSREYINDVGYSRYCFWFVGANPAKYKHIPELVARFNYIRSYRANSPVDRIQKTADTPYLFTQNRQPDTQYLIIPRVSSEKRRYIPVGFLPPDVIASDSAVLVYNASLYEFGIICSNVHNAWMRTVAGRLESRYRYAPSVYYNFPFPQVSTDVRMKVEQTAQAILDARKLYPENNLADMYGEEMYLFPELLKAHQQNDKAVMQAYGFWGKLNTETECVAELMKMYQELTK